MPTTLRGSPATIQVGSRAVEAIPFDLTDSLGAGESASSPNSALTDLTTGATYAAGIVSTALAGSVITVTVHDLVAEHVYRLEVWYSIAATAKVEHFGIQIVCPF